MKEIKNYEKNSPFFISMATAATFVLLIPFWHSISRKCLDQTLRILVGISYAM
jgi:hypothetical protein